jgi:succinate dehydrogenase/fumarate reductase-like Fe-S protein
MKSGAKDAVTRRATVFAPHAKAVLEAGADSLLTSINTLDQIDMIKSLDLKSPAASPEERRAAAAFHAERADACLMCGSCRRTCPNGVPVHDLMRIRMYHDEYGWADHARAEFQAIAADAQSVAARCTNCAACAAACPTGLASPAAVQRMASLFA